MNIKFLKYIYIINNTAFLWSYFVFLLIHTFHLFFPFLYVLTSYFHSSSSVSPRECCQSSNNVGYSLCPQNLPYRTLHPNLSSTDFIQTRFMSRSLQDTCSHSSSTNTYDAPSFSNKYHQREDITSPDEDFYARRERHTMKRSLSVGIPRESLCSRSAPSLVGRRAMSGNLIQQQCCSSAPSSFTICRKPKLNKCRSIGGESCLHDGDFYVSEEQIPEYWKSEDKIALEDEVIRTRSSSFSGTNAEKPALNSLSMKQKSSTIPSVQSRNKNIDGGWVSKKKLPKRQSLCRELPMVGTYYGYDSEYSGAETEVYVSEQPHDVYQDRDQEYSQNLKQSSEDDEDDYPLNCIDCISLKVPSLTELRKGDVAEEKAILSYPIKTPPHKRPFIKSNTEGDIYNPRQNRDVKSRYFLKTQGYERRLLPHPLQRNQSWSYGIRPTHSSGDVRPIFKQPTSYYANGNNSFFVHDTHSDGSRRVPNYNFKYLDVPGNYAYNSSQPREILQFPKTLSKREKQDHYTEGYDQQPQLHRSQYAFEQQDFVHPQDVRYQTYTQNPKSRYRSDLNQKNFCSMQHHNPSQHHESYSRNPSYRDDSEIYHPPNSTFDDDNRQVATRVRHSSSVSINEHPEYFEYDANSPPSNEPHPDADVDPSFNPASEISPRVTATGSCGANPENSKRGQLGRSMSTGEVPETEKTG